MWMRDGSAVYRRSVASVIKTFLSGIYLAKTTKQPIHLSASSVRLLYER
jgi:hypothetical protein